MSKIEVDTIDTQSSTTLQVGSTNTSLIKIGTSGDTVEYPAGTTFTQSGTQNVTSGGAINVKSGGSIIIESGAAITNNGTATGFSADLTNLNATNLTSGTVPDARFPATLPIASGSALTNLNATNLGSGTVPDARFPATLPAISGANLTNLPASGITMADQWRITSDRAGSNQLTANWERADTLSAGFIGTGLSESSGVFTFPATGIYQIFATAYMASSGSIAYGGIAIQITTNNSSYATAAESYNNCVGGGQNLSTFATYVLDVTNTTNTKFRLNGAADGGNVTYGGSTASNLTNVVVIRLGDT